MHAVRVRVGAAAWAGAEDVPELPVGVLERAAGSAEAGARGAGSGRGDGAVTAKFAGGS